jgi:hypothetical protein
MAKLCEGGEGFQAERIEFHVTWPDPDLKAPATPNTAVETKLTWHGCSDQGHLAGCRFLDFHDFFHLTRRGTFGDFPHWCKDRRYCEPRSATVQITTTGTLHAGQWTDVYTDLNVLAEDRTEALNHLHELQVAPASATFPAAIDRLEAFGGMLQSLLDFDRIDWWELCDALQPIDHAEGYVLYLHKGVLLNLAESDRAASVEQSRAYVGINPYLLAAHTVLLHNDQVLRLARAERRALPPDVHAEELRGRDLDLWREGYQVLDVGLYSHFLPNVFNYPTEQTIYERGHQELGLTVEHEALGRQFEHVGRRIEATQAYRLGRAQLHIGVWALIVAILAFIVTVPAIVPSLQTLAEQAEEIGARILVDTSRPVETAQTGPAASSVEASVGPLPASSTTAAAGATDTPSDDGLASASGSPPLAPGQQPAPAGPLLALGLAIAVIGLGWAILRRY